jgi:hypothetical protein
MYTYQNTVHAMDRTAHRPKPVEALEQHENGIGAENLDAYRDPLSPTQISGPIARSSPSFSVTLIDHSSSTPTFSGRLFSHSIPRSVGGADAQGFNRDSNATNACTVDCKSFNSEVNTDNSGRELQSYGITNRFLRAFASSYPV